MPQVHAQLRKLGSNVLQVWDGVNHDRVTKVFNAGDDQPVVSSCVANIDAQGQLALLVTQNGYTYTVTEPTPGAVTRSDPGTIIWSIGIVLGPQSFITIKNAGCYVVIGGGAIPGGIAYRAGDQNILESQKGEGTWAKTTP